MKEISKEEALKEMRFLFNGYKDITSCSNPSKENIKLMQAVEMAIIALEQYQEDKSRPQTIGCFNCKHEDKRLIEEPCKYCNENYREWEPKGGKEE